VRLGGGGVSNFSFPPFGIEEVNLGYGGGKRCLYIQEWFKLNLPLFLTPFQDPLSFLPLLPWTPCHNIIRHVMYNLVVTNILGQPSLPYLKELQVGWDH